MNDKVTYTKAFGIILMVIGHSGCSIPYMTQTIYMFHMPLFFFFAGYCFKKSYLYCPITFLNKKIKGLYCPYVKWSLLFLLMHNLFLRIHFYNMDSEYYELDNGAYSFWDICEHGKTIILYMKGQDLLLGGFWFLKSLFYASIIAYVGFYAIDKIKYNTLSPICFKITLLVIFLISVVLMNGNFFSISHVENISKPFYAASYFVAGHCFAEKQVREFNRLQVCVSFVLVFLGGFFLRMDMDSSSYDSIRIIPSFIVAIIGIWGVYSLPWSYLKGKCDIVLRFIGENTLMILALHFLSFKMASFIIIILLGLPIASLADFPIIEETSEKNYYWIIYVLMGVFIPCGIAHLIEKLRSIQICKLQ